MDRNEIDVNERAEKNEVNIQHYLLRDTAGNPEQAKAPNLPALVANCSARFGSYCSLAELNI